MVGIVVVSHGKFAEALISSAQSLMGHIQRVRGVSIWPKDREKEVKQRIQEGIEEVNDGDGVVVLTDVLGGTPTNFSLSLVETEKVEVVTGVNLPMVMTLISYRKGRPLSEIAKLVTKSGRRSITLAKELLGLEVGKQRTASIARVVKGPS
jgi:mannose PTS system EIIA component